MANLNMDLSGYEAQEGFDVLPPGWYEAMITDSDIKDGPKGKYINWTFEIIGKPGRVWDIMSLGSDVSKKRLKSLLECTGHNNPNYIADTEELHGKTCLVKLKIEKSEEYGDKNKIADFKPIEGHTQAKAPVAASAPTEKAKPKMPWEKSAA